MREFLLFSRKGRTDARFETLREAGRLDLVYQCILMALFRSHSIRKDVIFHAVLGGPPRPPLHLMVRGDELRDVRVDERTWHEIFRAVLAGGKHPGIEVRKESLQHIVRSHRGKIFVLEERGEDVDEVEFGKNPLFVLGDQVGLPKKDESFVLRYGSKISLGKRPYLAASCIDIINYIIDRRELSD